MHPEKRRVLVTGGAGYLGSVLCEHLLDEGFAVDVLDTLAFRQNSLFHLCAHPRFNFIKGDARDRRVLAPLVARADVIIPLAAIVGAPACNADPIAAQSLNFDAIKLLNELRTPAQLVVYPNTNSGYGLGSGETFCTEETALAPISIYGRTKCEAELLLLAAENAVTLRLATVFGASPRMRLDLLVNHFTYAAATDRYLVIFEKDFRRNFVHVRDVADAFIHAIRHASEMKGRAFNVGLDNANLSKAGLAEKIKEHVPEFYIHYAAVGSDPDKRDYIVSNARLAAAGFTAQRDLDHGIRELLKLYRMLPLGEYRNA